MIILSFGLKKYKFLIKTFKQLSTENFDVSFYMLHILYFVPVQYVPI